MRDRTIFWGGARSVAVGDSLCNLVIPLLLGLAVEETNDDHGHVVTTNATSLGVGCQAVVHHVFTNLVKILLGSDSSANKLDDSLRRLAIPDTVTGENQELVLFSQFMLINIWESCDNLVLGRELSALLEFEVTNGTGQSQVAIDTTKVDETTSGSNSVSFA